LAGRLIVTERFTCTWRGKIKPTTARTTNKAMRPMNIFFIMAGAPSNFCGLSGAAFFQFAGRALHVVRQSHFLDQSKLLFNEVDVLFFALLYVHQQITSHEVLDGLAVRNGR